MIIGRTANITEPIQEEPIASTGINAGWVVPFGGYFSTQSSTLPAAMKTGNLTVRPGQYCNKNSIR